VVASALPFVNVLSSPVLVLHVWQMNSSYFRKRWFRSFHVYGFALHRWRSCDFCTMCHTYPVETWNVE